MGALLPGSTVAHTNGDRAKGESAPAAHARGRRRGQLCSGVSKTLEGYVTPTGAGG